ncbi:MAG: hypothetical protein WAO61_10030 [Solirubrobacterales bacterium]
MRSPLGSPAAGVDRPKPRIALGIAAIAGAQLVTAALILLTPRWFFDHIGTFGAYNVHYLRDAGAMTLGAGLALVASLKWRVLRAGALATNLAIIVVHAVNHWVDIGNAHAGSDAGISGAVSLTLFAGFTAAVTLAATKRGDA